jgi:hypothetical protein
VLRVVDSTVRQLLRTALGGEFVSAVSIHYRMIITVTLPLMAVQERHVFDFGATDHFRPQDG